MLYAGYPFSLLFLMEANLTYEAAPKTAVIRIPLYQDAVKKKGKGRRKKWDNGLRSTPTHVKNGNIPYV